MRSSPSRGTKMRFEPCLRATVASNSSCQRRKVISSMTLNRASSLLSMLAEGNKLTEISENLFSSWTMLTEFNASKNLLNGIPDSIGGLSRLIHLDLHQNNELFHVIHIFLEVKQINMELECLHWYLARTFGTSISRN
ncbi:uncharacterized protein LOC107458199 [Arachis duranensis]|uniref:Uncharacterized protein LOC107458199 n=1 Tax=Arachis duranensis TaxID=130453 RepID=A0A9C6T062_ARADU|nr:uncharacterized protein LOC107458199 [Arachis duranensis]